MSAVAEWFYAVNNQRFGPVSLPELQTKALNQELKPTDLVWKPGFANWTPAHQVPGIFLDRTMMGEVSSQQPPMVAEALEKTQVSTPQPESRPAVDSTPATPTETEEEKLYLTEFPGAAHPVAGLDSLPAEEIPSARIHPRPAWLPEQSFPGGFPLRWNLRGIVLGTAEQSQCRSGGVDDPHLQQYLVWRRGLLLLLIVPAALCVIFGLVNVLTADGLTTFGHLMNLLRLVPLIAMAAAVMGGIALWSKWKTSRRILQLGWLVAFAIPLALALIPTGWQLDMPKWVRLGEIPVFWMVSGLGFFLHVLPILWAVPSGCLRAALRLKELTPEATFPGWLAVFIAPVQALVTLALFLPIHALVGNPLFVLAGLCFVIAPLFFLWRARTLLQPLSTEAEKSAVAMAQLLNFILAIAGFVLLMIYVFSLSVFERGLIGLDADKSWLRPWNGHLLLFPLELFARSLMATLVASDLFLYFSRMYWFRTKETLSTPAAQVHEEFLEGVGRSYDR